MADGFRVDVKVEIFPDKVNKIVRDPGGPVSLHVKRTAEEVLKAAIPLIGTRYSGHHPERGPQLKSTGSVVKGSPGGPDWVVRFDHPIAFMHHEGSRAHEIPFKDGRTSGGKRTFYRSQPEVFGPVRRPINHPGHRGNPFLINAAASLGLRASGALLRGKDLSSIFRTGFA